MTQGRKRGVGEVQNEFPIHQTVTNLSDSIILQLSR